MPTLRHLEALQRRNARILSLVQYANRYSGGAGDHGHEYAGAGIVFKYVVTFTSSHFGHRDEVSRSDQELQIGMWVCIEYYTYVRVVVVVVCVIWSASDL